jgi:hypothetical protein
MPIGHGSAYPHVGTSCEKCGLAKSVPLELNQKGIKSNNQAMAVSTRRRRPAAEVARLFPVHRATISRINATSRQIEAV